MNEARHSAAKCRSVHCKAIVYDPLWFQTGGPVHRTHGARAPCTARDPPPTTKVHYHTLRLPLRTSLRAATHTNEPATTTTTTIRCRFRRASRRRTRGTRRSIHRCCAASQRPSSACSGRDRPITLVQGRETLRSGEVAERRYKIAAQRSRRH